MKTYYKLKQEFMVVTIIAVAACLCINIYAGETVVDLGLIFFIMAAIGLISLIVHAIKFEKDFREKKKLLCSDIFTIDALDGIAFERYLAVHFKRLGYKVKVTPPQGDYGVDLIISKGKDHIAVQAKRYSREVSYKAVQEVVAGKAMYHCNKAMVVTNSTFTEAGKILARKNNVELWDRSRLIEEFNISTSPRELLFM